MQNSENRLAKLRSEGDSITIRDRGGEKIVARLIENAEEKVLQIHSQQKEVKETSIKSKFELLFLEKLDQLREGFLFCAMEHPNIFQ